MWLSEVCSNPRSTLCLYQALLVSVPGDEESFSRIRQNDEQRRSLIHCILVRVLDTSGREMESAYVLQQSRCVLMLVNRLQIMVERALVLPDLESMLEKLESYCWMFIGYAVDSVRNNVRNTLAKITAILDPEQLKDLIARLDAIRWGDKRKLLALLSVARVAGADPLTRHIKDLSKDVLSVMVNDTTVANLCHDLFETLMKSAFPSDRSKVPHWIREWVQPLFEMSSECSELNRLRMTAMKLDDGVTFYAVKLEADKASLSYEEIGNRLKIGLMGLKILKQRSVNSKEYLENECFKRALSSYSDEVRLQAMDCIVSSRSGVESFNGLEFRLILSALESNLALHNASGRQNFMGLMKMVKF